MIQESSELDGNEAEAQHLILSTVKSKKSPVEDKDRWSMDTVCALDPKTEIKSWLLPYSFYFWTWKISKTSAAFILKGLLAFYCFQEHECDEKTN
jgi:hypothetical protein